MFFIIYEKEVSVVSLVVVTTSVLVIQLKLNLHSEKIRGFFFLLNFGILWMGVLGVVLTPRTLMWPPQ